MPELPEVEAARRSLTRGVVRFHRDGSAPGAGTAVLFGFTGRAGPRCPGCGGTVRGGRFHGRPTFFCPRCQR